MFLIIAGEVYNVAGYLRLDELPCTIVGKCRTLLFLTASLGPRAFRNRATIINSAQLINTPSRV